VLNSIYLPVVHTCFLHADQPYTLVIRTLETYVSIKNSFTH